MTPAQVAFGSQLRREREQREITLASVAESTKINRGLLGSLERGDASHWPKGIYRRAFIREYATAIGLSADTVSAEFLRLFPEAGAVDAEAARGIAGDGTALRLTLAHEEQWSVRSLAPLIGAAVADGAAVFALSAISSALLHTNIWGTMGVLALAYQLIGTTCMGGSAALTLMNAASARRGVASNRRARTRPNSRELLRIVATTRPEDRGPADEADAQFLEDARSAS